MRNILLLFVLILTYGCKFPENYPDEPQIALKNVSFEKDEDNVSYTAVVVDLEFTDGNGDLGLYEDETYEPYHFREISLNNEGKWIEKFGSNKNIESNFIINNRVDSVHFIRGISQDSIVVKFSSGFESRAEEFGENYYWYTLDYWHPYSDNQDKQSSTILVKNNPNSSNLFIEIYKKQNGEFSLLSFGDIQSEQFKNRFTRLDQGREGDPLEGEIQYNFDVPSIRFLVKRFDTLKVKAWIQDRALNKSNVVEGGPYILE
ncbi:hypothetical protein [Aureibacter tunicatorum]|uniref:NigD-like protein n=1 Tax=Aureibacter tunicatorum TaxID=866807 RepID=A0AAE4BR20_9BACT|nr:hypothetical protein [Aureibacter tunicatorum]MDR6238196.1 hypothetical protein [Aureibacter tunicatorum]BDD03229.1 hypothetical protein AUTU_07120 [Aureibacter tunicatorum]